MRTMFNWLGVGLAVGCLLVGCAMVASILNGAVERQQAKKEQCIYLKYQKDAQKFLDKGCGGLVNYNQYND